MKVLLLLLLSTTTTHAFTPPHILSVGLAAVDFVATVDHFPTPDEKMRSQSLQIFGGGNAANTACAIGKLGLADVTLVSALGDDNAVTIEEGLKEMNVEPLVERYAGSSPFSYILCADIDGESTRTCIHQPSTGDMSVDFVNDIDLEPYTAAHFDLRYPDASMVLAKRCADAKLLYSVDVERPRPGLEEILKDATIVICNSDYCKSILPDEKDPAVRLRKVIAKQAPKAKIAVQTLGSKGSCLILMDDDDHKSMKRDATLFKGKPMASIRDGALYCAAFTGGKVVDTTGAGDSFQGGFLSALWAYSAQTKSKDGNVELPTDPMILAHCLRIASRVAAKKCEQPGARSGLPSREQDDFLKSETTALLGRVKVAS